MRSRVTFTVEHDETTDAFQAFVEHGEDIAASMFTEAEATVEVDV